MWKPVLIALFLGLASACETPPSGPVDLTILSDDTVLPSVSDRAGWEAHLPWGTGLNTPQSLGKGVEYIALANGDPAAALPLRSDDVAVYYQLRLAGSGEIVDDSFGRDTAPILSLRNVVAGWQNALTQMHAGDRWLIFVPAGQGYGREGSATVPPNADLIFEVKLLGVPE